ncbi:MAG TPA: type II secretion system secretin GspD [Casimicrobiaceae bacterium]|nr:type II secretion system secretin GspD [Casimicrobiaceae bacterium]
MSGQTASAPSAANAAESADAVTLNFVNAEIDAVVKAVAEITGRNFIVDPRVKGTVNIVSARPVPRNLVYPTLLSALRLSGYAAVESDGVVKIVPEADAKTQGGTVGRGSGDRLVTQVVVLRNESAASLVNVLRPLITPNNTIAAFPASNALVITDYAGNLRRIERLIATLDQPDRAEPLLVPVKHASAIDVAGLVNRLLAEPGAQGAPADPQQRVSLVPDPRSNSILVRSDNAGRAARVRSLIEQLDTPGRPGGNLFIVYLRNAEAARVAQTLRALLTGTDAAPAGPSQTSLAPPGAFAMASASSPPPGSAPASAAPAPLPFSAPASAASAFSANGVTVQADVANNALIIMAPEPVYNNLRAIIEKLDVRRAQVYVEALIVEVSADKAAELGIQWNALSGYNTTGTRVIGGTNFTPRGSGSNILDVAISPGSVGQGLNIGVMRGTINIPGLGTITNLGMLARALESNVNANILSTPGLMTLDNEEARIIVGQNVPFVTGSYATTGTAGTTSPTPFNTFERRDIGLLLRVRPQITEGGAVRLNIYQEVSRIQEVTTSTGIILSKRALESNVVVDDSNIIVLGGLIEDRLTDGNDKVPIAGDVPVVGSLFRYDARRREKTNLMVFLKPTVVRGTQDGREITSERYDYLMGEQQRNVPAPLPYWADPSRPELPPQNAMPGDRVTREGQTQPWPNPPHPLAPFVPQQPWPAPVVPATAPPPSATPITPVVPNPTLPGTR